MMAWTPQRAYRDLLIAGSEAITKVEMAGFRYNVEKAADLYDFELSPEMKKLTEEMRDQIDNPLFNPKSNPQVQRLYYDSWRIKHEMQQRPDKKRSADEAALKEINAGRFACKNPLHRGEIQQFTKILMRYRKIQKQASTYIVGLIEKAVNDPDGRVYTDLLLHGTTSGRLSSRDPNLQNVTRVAEDLPSIRGLFEASPGRLVVQADFSQAELRCIAQFSQDPILLDIYMNDKDLHSMTAERFYGPKFTKANRDNSKNMNFGMFYRQSAATFQEKHDIPEKEAQKYIDWAKETFPTVWEWEKTIEVEIRSKGVLVSPFGRKRRFHLLTPENKFAVFREGINFFPQSTASDFTLRSLILLSRQIDWSKASLVLTVHDSILADVEESYVLDYSTTCQQIMESRPKEDLGWDIPFKVDISTGETWGDCK